MAEKDPSARLRRAVKGTFAQLAANLLLIVSCILDNNLFLVKRLLQRTDMRNPDPATRRYTSLGWAAVLRHEETFEYLLAHGHDDEELSRVSRLFPYTRSCSLILHLVIVGFREQHHIHVTSGPTTTFHTHRYRRGCANGSYVLRSLLGARTRDHGLVQYSGKNRVTHRRAQRQRGACSCT